MSTDYLTLTGEFAGIADGKCIAIGCKRKEYKERLCKMHQNLLLDEYGEPINTSTSSDADKLYSALKESSNGLTRREQSKVFSGNRTAKELAGIRRELERQELAYEITVSTRTKPQRLLILDTNVDEEDAKLVPLAEQDDDGTDTCDLCGALIPEEMCIFIEGAVDSNCPLLEQPVRGNRK